MSLLSMIEPSLPIRCEPENDYLRHLSATFHTCVPTNLALLSTLLGTLSIISWLFAQLPQIYKNHKLKSTSGLSLFFLVEWLLGDLSNLLGSVFTMQALWQVILACYYVCVDCMLVGQWIWYEILQHGRPLRPAWSRRGTSDTDRDGMAQVYEGVSIGSPTSDRSGGSDSKDSQAKSSYSVPIHRSNPMDAFRIPNFARSPGSPGLGSSAPNTPSQSNLGTTPNRTVTRLARSNSPMPSPKTVLYISLLLAIISNTATASPILPNPSQPLSTFIIEEQSPAEILAGKLLSWLSTLLYLGSRLPQLYKNHVRRSTDGLSPTLFIAAFFGNLFYSSSLLTNPCAWNDYKAGEGRGWVDEEGSVRGEWVSRAAPFFLGAAGVLVMDAAVGVQFWLFGEKDERRGRAEEVVAVLNDGEGLGRRRWRWRRVSGWMRGWIPAVSVAGTPAGSLSGTPREQSPAGSEGGRSALDEARALLGTGRSGSRGGSYGGTS